MTPMGGPSSTVTASGTYTGNDSANRAIPHGLSGPPKSVTIFDEYSRVYWHIADYASIGYQSGATIAQKAVTAFDSANFYVGNVADYTQTANAGTVVYYWVAIG